MSLRRQAALAAVLAAATAAVLPPDGAAGATPVTALPPPDPPPTEVVPGVVHRRLERSGGQVVHLLTVAPGPRRAVGPVLAGGSPRKRAPLTGAIRSRRAAGAVAGINGDFFNSRLSYPSGLMLAAGELVSEPEAGRSSLLFGPGARLAVARLAFAARYESSDPAGVAPPRARRIDGMNRPPERGSEVLLYTPAYGAATTPTGASLFEARVRLDRDRPVEPNEVRTGTVVATGAGGGMRIGAGHAVVTGVGASGRGVSLELAPGRRVSLHTGIAGLPPGARAGIGGGPLLVQAGRPVADAGEAFSDSQIHGRTSRSAVGQRPDGAILLVVAEGPAQGSPGISVPEQAALMADLGADIAIGLDGGGSSQLAVGDELVTRWGSPRAVATALLVSYDGFRMPPLPFRISPNGDGVVDRSGVMVRATRPGRTRVTLVRRPSNRTTRLLDAPVGPGGVPVRIDPGRLGAPDGVYLVIARHVPDDGSPPTTQRRRVIVDRALSHMTARPARVRVGKRRRPVLDTGFRLRRPARVSVQVRDPAGRLIKTVTSGRRLGTGRHTIRWNRRARGDEVTGRVRVSVVAHTRLGRSGLERPVTLGDG